MRTVVPLWRRPIDLACVAFFLINLTCVTYIIDLEQIVIADPSRFQYPAWPPHTWVDLIHWWGRNYDPLLLARPAFWRGAIWIDVLFFGPFYAVASYAFIKGRDWIRIPSIVWASVLLTNVTLILFEELAGTFATPRPDIVLLANAPWVLFPILVLARMARRGFPSGGDAPVAR